MPIFKYSWYEILNWEGIKGLIKLFGYFDAAFIINSKVKDIYNCSSFLIDFSNILFFIKSDKKGKIFVSINEFNSEMPISIIEAKNLKNI